MIICVTGKAGAGKDTICDYLVKNYSFEKMSLADPIKRLVKDVFVLDDETVYDRIKREQPLPQWNNKSVRSLLQLIGTELFRNNIDNEIWVKSLWLRMSKNLIQNYCVSDVRFPDELEYLTKNNKNTVSIKVVRDGCNGQVGLQNHESEKYDLKTDIRIENNKTIDELYKNIDYILKEIKL